MRISPGHLLPALLLLVPAAAAQPRDGEEIARRAGRVYRGLSSLSADFQQLIEDRMIGNQESAGRLVQAGNARLSMRFSEPEGDAILIDGTHVWIYTPSTTPGQVIRMVLPNDPVYGPNVLARILDRPDERYRVTWIRTDSLGGQMVDVVSFEPNAADPLFRRAVIWIDRRTALPRRLELDELTGVRRILTLDNIRVNVAVSEETFRFRVPSGVRVVEQ